MHKNEQASDQLFPGSSQMMKRLEKFFLCRRQFFAKNEIETNSFPSKSFPIKAEKLCGVHFRELKSPKQTISAATIFNVKKFLIALGNGFVDTSGLGNKMTVHFGLPLLGMTDLLLRYQ